MWTTGWYFEVSSRNWLRSLRGPTRKIRRGRKLRTRRIKGTPTCLNFPFATSFATIMFTCVAKKGDVGERTEMGRWCACTWLTIRINHETSPSALNSKLPPGRSSAQLCTSLRIFKVFTTTLDLQNSVFSLDFATSLKCRVLSNQGNK